MGLWNQPNGRFKLMARQKTQGKVDSRINFKMYSTIFLYSKKEWIIMIDTRLQEIKLAYSKE